MAEMMYLPVQVRQIIGSLYGIPAWAETLDRCRQSLAAGYGVNQSEIPGRLAALAMAGHNREALLAVAVAFGIVPEAEREEVEYRQTWAPLHTGRRGDGG